MIFIPLLFSEARLIRFKWPNGAVFFFPWTIGSHNEEDAISPILVGSCDPNCDCSMTVNAALLSCPNYSFGWTENLGVYAYCCNLLGYMHRSTAIPVFPDYQQEGPCFSLFYFDLGFHGRPIHSPVLGRLTWGNGTLDLWSPVSAPSWIAWTCSLSKKWGARLLVRSTTTVMH